MKNIQLFVPTFDIDECLKEIRECLEKGWTGLGYKTIEFENQWKEYTGLPHAHYLNSNTIGLQLAVKIFKEENKWSDGDEIISTPLTFVSTNHAILYEGLKPVFADVDDSLCLDPDSVLRRITPRTRAVMYVGMGGNTGRLNDIAEICRTKKIKFILDAAHMAGTRFNGKHIGYNADCTIFSYQAVKNLPSADSGMICFADGELDKIVRMYSWLGINKDTYARTTGMNKGEYKWYYDVSYVGLKAHGNSVIASLCIAQLKHLDRDNARRREISALYDSRFQNNPSIRLIRMATGCESSRHLYQIAVDQILRDPLISYLNEKNIFPGVHYRTNTDYKMYSYAKGTCPKAEKYSTEIISLPLHMKLTDDEVNYVADQVIKYMSKNNTGA